jgi:hypothetical protein
MRKCFLSVALVLAAVSANAQGLSKDQYGKAMAKALDDISAKATPKTRVQVAANLFYAHEAFIERMPIDVLNKIVDAFADAGVKRVDINVGLFPWVDADKDTIAKYDAVVARIRSKGMQLALNPQYSPVKHKVSDLNAWRQSALPVFSSLAERYKPDIFVVAHEPTTMSARMQSKASVESWRDFVRDAAKTVKQKSPKSRIGAGGLFEEERYFNAFVDLPEVEVLTLDVYRLVGLPKYAAMVKRAQSKGKPVYIEETWRPPYYTGRGGGSIDQTAAKSVGDRTFEDLDIKWMRAISRWAGALGIEAITPVWMQAFFKYVDGDGDALDPGYNRQVIDAIMRGERTKTYEALRAVGRDSK